MRTFGMEAVETDCEYKWSLKGTWTCKNTSTLTKQDDDFIGGKKKIKKWLVQALISRIYSSFDFHGY